MEIEATKKKEIKNKNVNYNKIFLRNTLGSYLSTTISSVNTKRQHALLAMPLKESDFEKHVILSSIKESLIQNGIEFNMNVYKETGTYHPDIFNKINSVNTEYIFESTINLSGIRVKKQVNLAKNYNTVYIKYIIEEASSFVKLRLKPEFAFRKTNELNKNINFSNISVNNNSKGFNIKHKDYPEVFVQTNRKGLYSEIQQVFKNYQYSDEVENFDNNKENLLLPFAIEISMKKNDSFIFSCGLTKRNTELLQLEFENEYQKRKNVQKADVFRKAQ